MDKFYFPLRSYLFIFDKSHFSDIPTHSKSIYDFLGQAISVHTTFPYKITDEVFLFLLCIMLSMLFYFGLNMVRTGKIDGSQIIKWAVIFSAITSISIPLGNTKLFSYIGYGVQQSVYDQNPYFQNITNIRDYLQNPLFINVEDFSGSVFYGPLFLYIAKLVLILSNNNLFLAFLNFKLLNLFCFLCAILYLLKFDNNEDLYLVAWNPIVYVFGLWNGSSNILLGTLLFFAIYLLFKNKLFWGTACLIVACGINYLPILILPLLVFCLLKNKPTRSSISNFLLGISCGTLFVTIFSIDYFLPPAGIDKNWYLNLLQSFSEVRFSFASSLCCVFQLFNVDADIWRQIIIYAVYFVFALFYFFLLIKRGRNIFEDITLLLLIFLCFGVVRFLSADILSLVFLIPFTKSPVVRQIIIGLSCINIFSVTILGRIEILNYLLFVFFPIGCTLFLQKRKP